MSGLAITPSALAPKPASEQARLTGAARGFEAILVRQMLAAARAGGFGDALSGGQATETFRSMQDARFADLVAQSGTLGLARTIERQLAATIAPARAEKP